MHKQAVKNIQIEVVLQRIIFYKPTACSSQKVMSIHINKLIIPPDHVLAVPSLVAMGSGMIEAIGVGNGLQLPAAVSVGVAVGWYDGLALTAHSPLESLQKTSPGG